VLLKFHADLKNLEIGSHVSQTLFEDVAKIAKDIEFVATELANPMHKTSTAGERDCCRFASFVFAMCSFFNSRMRRSIRPFHDKCT
jgi:hypothetical protein